MVIRTLGGVYVGGGTRYHQDLHFLISEHYCPIYCNSYNIGAIYDGGTATGVMGPKVVAEIGRAGLVGNVGGSKQDRGGGDRNGGGEGVWVG